MATGAQDSIHQKLSSRKAAAAFKHPQSTILDKTVEEQIAIIDTEIGNIQKRILSVDEDHYKGHIDEMKQEIAEWKDLFKRVKIECKVAQSKCNNVQTLTWNDCVNDLSQDDIKFYVEQRPDYSKFARRIDDLEAAVAVLANKKFLARETVLNNIKLAQIKINNLNHVIGKYFDSCSAFDNIIDWNEADVSDSEDILPEDI